MDRPMRPRPLIFVVSPEPDVVTAMEQLLANAGCIAACCLLSADPYAMIVTFWPDLLVIECPDHEPRALALLKKLDRAPVTRDVPIIATAPNNDNLTAFSTRDQYRHRDAVIRMPVDSGLLLALIDHMTQVFT